MKKIHLLLLSVVSGVLFTLGWPVNGFPAFLFTALVPMLIIEQYIADNREDYSRFSVFFYTYPGFFIWNFATSYWIWNSTPVAALAWGFNAMFMSMVMNIFHASRKNIYGKNQGYFLLVFLWIAFEFVHINWKLTWPWLNLGHGFAVYNKWIQWYEFTGILGGTAWIIIVNILIFKALRQLMIFKSWNKNLMRKFLGIFGLIIVPIIISYFIYYGYEEEKNPIGVVITQPNVDPYSEQYSLPPQEVIDRNLNLAETQMDDKTTFIIAPESALQENIWEGSPKKSSSLKILTKYVLENPNINIIIGASTFRQILDGEPIPNSARYWEKYEYYYDRYNTAILINSQQEYQKHHKSKLTPGVEFMPSWGPLSFIEDMAIDLGGTVGSLGIDKEQIPFVVDDTISVAPLICYESVYGEFCGNFIKNGAQVLVVITNDGWWGNTPGHKQHLYFSSLRAIEHRRCLARSANTGISTFVDQRGDLHQNTKYWEPDVIKQDVNLNNKTTFYTRMGDYIGRVSAFLSVIFILLAFVFGIRKRKELAKG